MMSSASLQDPNQYTEINYVFAINNLEVETKKYYL